MIKINFIRNLNLENIIKTKNWLYKKFESSFKTSQNTNLSEPHSRKRESWIWWILRIIIIVHKYILRILGRCVRSLWWYTTLHAYHIPGYICIFVFSSLLLAPKGALHLADYPFFFVQIKIQMQISWVINYSTPHPLMRLVNKKNNHKCIDASSASYLVEINYVVCHLFPAQHYVLVQTKYEIRNIEIRFYLFTLSNIPFHHVELYPVCGETPSRV